MVGVILAVPFGLGTEMIGRGPADFFQMGDLFRLKIGPFFAA
jgi:hypothetical protein